MNVAKTEIMTENVMYSLNSRYSIRVIDNNTGDIQIYDLVHMIDEKIDIQSNGTQHIVLKFPTAIYQNELECIMRYMNNPMYTVKFVKIFKYYKGEYDCFKQKFDGTTEKVMGWSYDIKYMTYKYYENSFNDRVDDTNRFGTLIITTEIDGKTEYHFESEEEAEEWENHELKRFLL